MITSKKAIECAETLAQFCEEQKGCQNCIFRKSACDHWDCRVNGFDLRYDMDEIKGNAEAKKRNHGYI